MLAPWKKSYDKPRQHIKKQRHYFTDKGPYSQSYGFSTYGCESWTIKKAEHQRIDDFELWCWKRFLRVPSPPASIFLSIRFFSNELALCIRWPEYWSFSFSFSFSPSIEYSGLISLRMDWLDLLAVQGTLKSLLQHHSSKVSILQSSAFFMV